MADAEHFDRRATRQRAAEAHSKGRAHGATGITQSQFGRCYLRQDDQRRPSVERQRSASVHAAEARLCPHDRHDRPRSGTAALTGHARASSASRRYAVTPLLSLLRARITGTTPSAAPLFWATSTSTPPPATTSAGTPGTCLNRGSRDIALHFGHRDGGELVRELYGHADAALARERVPRSVPQRAARARSATPGVVNGSRSSGRRTATSGVTW